MASTLPAKMKMKQSPSTATMVSSAPGRLRPLHKSATVAGFIDQLSYDTSVRVKAADIKVKSAWTVRKNGKSVGEIRVPKSVCFLKDGQVAISEGKNARLQIFNAEGKSSVVIDKSVDKDMLNPSGICGALGGQMLLATDTRDVCIYNCRGKPLGRRSIGRSSALTAITPFDDRDNVVVSDVGTNPTVAICNLSGKIITRFRDKFISPRFIATDQSTSTTCVSDVERHVVTIYDRNGKQISILGHHSNASPALLWPMGVAFNERGNILVADQASHVVSEYSVHGQYLHDVLDADEGIINPIALASDRKNRVAVTSSCYDFKSNKFTLEVFSAKKVALEKKR